MADDMGMMRALGASMNFTNDVLDVVEMDARGRLDEVDIPTAFARLDSYVQIMRRELDALCRPAKG
jgi:hypothetical protein